MSVQHERRLADGSVVSRFFPVPAVESRSKPSARPLPESVAAPVSSSTRAADHFDGPRPEDPVEKEACTDRSKRLDGFEDFDWTAPVSVEPSSIGGAATCNLPSGAAFVCFDTETTGTGRNAAVLQLAYGIFDAKGKLLRPYSQLLRLLDHPVKQMVGWGAYKIHKISRKRVQRDGVDARTAIERFFRVCVEVRAAGGRVVAHNAAFDCRMLRQTAAMHGSAMAPLEPRHVFCTQRASRQLVAARDRNGRIKDPRNSELYTRLMKAEPTGQLHDALEDVKLTAASYAAGLEKGWWHARSV